MSLAITGIADDYRKPGSYVEILFAQGPSTAGSGAREIAFVMPKDGTAGSWSANTLYEVSNEQEAIDGAGEGSPIHRAMRAALQVNKTAKYWCVPYLPSSGGVPVAADVDLTFATNPTASGTAEVFICGELAGAYAYSDADTPTTIATALKNSINAKLRLPVTSSNVAGVLTITARIDGASQGDGTIGQYQVYARVKAGTSVTVNSANEASVEVGDTVSGADGSTTEAANLQTALAVLDAKRIYWLGISMHDATGIGHLKTHLQTKSDPNPGLRSMGVAAYTHTKAGAQTLSTGLNYERVLIGMGTNLESDNATIVGNLCAAMQLEEQRENGFLAMDGYRDRWIVKPARSTSDWLSDTDINDLINDGLTVIDSDTNGSNIVMLVSTRSKDSAGNVDDFRAAEPHRVTISDRLADREVSRDAANFGNFRLADDELLADGTVNVNQDLAPRTITPHFYKFNFLIPEIQAYQDETGNLQNLAAMFESVVVQRHATNRGRLAAGHDIHSVDIRHQTTLRLAEVSPG